MKQENIISNIVLGVCTMLLVVVVLSNVYAFFPALTNSLGTLSDWFMVIITAITAIFLYRTLDSQMKVQKDQNRIFKIEEKKYLREIKPEITFLPFSTSKVWQTPLSNSPKNKLLGIKQRFTLTVDKDCIASYKLYSESKVYIEEFNKNLFLKLTNHMHFSFIINVIEYKSETPIFENIIFEITYTDKDKNEYKYFEEFTIKCLTWRSYPILINSIKRCEETIETVY